ALGMTGLLSSNRPAWLLTLLAAIALPFRWRVFARNPLGTRRRSNERGWLAIPFVALALIALGSALCYPTGWDEMVYHHELPRRWLADGWPAFYADIPYSGFPSLGELLFWLAAPLERLIAA